MGSEAVRLELPWPPSVNHYYRVAGSKVFIGKQGKDFRSSVYAYIKTLGIGRIGGRLEMTLDLYPPDLRRRDTDNILKALQDALTHAGIWDDDYSIWTTHIYRREPLPDQGGMVAVEIRGI